MFHFEARGFLLICENLFKQLIFKKMPAYRLVQIIQPTLPKKLSLSLELVITTATAIASATGLALGGHWAGIGRALGWPQAFGAVKIERQKAL